MSRSLPGIQNQNVSSEETEVASSDSEGKINIEFCAN